MSGNFYKGTSKDQTPFFKDKDSQLIAQRKWPAIFEQEVDMSKVNVEVMKAWINHKITELLGFEDDIVISYCLSQLVPEEALAADVDERKNYLCPKKLAISLTGFVGKQATHFVRELWKLLLSAQNTPTGIPPEFLENRRLEMERKREEAARINEELVRRHEQMMATEFNKQIKQFATGTAPPKPPTLVAYDTIPDTGGMRGWDNDDAPPARARAPSHGRSRSRSRSRSGGRSRRTRSDRHERRKGRRRSESRSMSRSPSRGGDRDRDRRRGRSSDRD
ncbi:PWI domain-containing protein, putative [Eimeria acervulina]|uniref:PWI domain-containing protein, putative n=1 Tax=Eimeria acervulina TaxID=5801 RepID=U6GQ57_EIMAC|nr:PWI domain-containing protein, putative [Eimeria acervulina]CDI81403.1 PWI domain-containing protein, putative [Eimeria acervulina]